MRTDLVDFPALLAHFARRAGLGLRAFAARIGCQESRVRQVAMGMRPPNLAQVEAWADALTLSETERRAFRLAAHLANSPALVRDIYRQLVARLSDLEGATPSLLLGEVAPDLGIAPADHPGERSAHAATAAAAAHA